MASPVTLPAERIVLQDENGNDDPAAAAYQLQLPESLLSSLARTSSHPSSHAASDDGYDTSLGFASHVPLRTDVSSPMPDTDHHGSRIIVDEDDEADKLSEISSTGLSDLSTVFSTEDEYYSLLASMRSADVDQVIKHSQTPRADSCAQAADPVHMNASNHGVSNAADTTIALSNASVSSVAQRYANMKLTTTSTSLPTRSVIDSAHELPYPSSISSLVSSKYQQHENRALSQTAMHASSASLGSSWDDAGSPLPYQRRHAASRHVLRSLHGVLDARSPIASMIGSCDNGRAVVDKISTADAQGKMDARANSIDALSRSSNRDTSEPACDSAVPPVVTDDHSHSDSSIYPPSTQSCSAPPTISSSLAASVAVTEHTFEMRTGSYDNSMLTSQAETKRPDDSGRSGQSHNDSTATPLVANESGGRCASDAPTASEAEKAAGTVSDRMTGVLQKIGARHAPSTSYSWKFFVVAGIVLSLAACYHTTSLYVTVPVATRDRMLISTDAVAVSPPIIPLSADSPTRTIQGEERQTVILPEASSAQVPLYTYAKVRQHHDHSHQAITDVSLAYHSEIAGFLACLASGSVVWLLRYTFKLVSGNFSKRSALTKNPLAQPQRRTTRSASVARPSSTVQLVSVAAEADNDDVLPYRPVPAAAAHTELSARQSPRLPHTIAGSRARASSIKTASPASAKKQVTFAQHRTIPQTPPALPISKPLPMDSPSTDNCNAPVGVMTRARTRSATPTLLCSQDDQFVSKANAFPDIKARTMSSTHAIALAALAVGRITDMPAPMPKSETLRSQCSSPGSTSCTSSQGSASPYAMRLRPRAPSASPRAFNNSNLVKPKCDVMHHVFVTSFDSSIEAHASKFLARVTGKQYPTTAETLMNYKCRSQSQLFKRDDKVVELVYRYAGGGLNMPSTYIDWETHNARFVAQQALRARDVFIYLYSSSNPVRHRLICAPFS